MTYVPKWATCERCKTFRPRSEMVRDQDRIRRWTCKSCPAHSGAPGTPETTLPVVLSDDDRRTLTTAGQKVAEWTQKRDQAIRDAVARGGSLREVGAAVGLSHMAVKFIAHGRPAKKEQER